MPFLLNKKTVITFAVIVVLSFFAPTVFAVWNGTFYEPGDTLNPECLPTDPDCDVRSPLTSLNISDTVYGASWDTDTTHAPSKNALYDKIEGLVAGSHDPITLGVSANGLSLSTQVISLALASTSTTGALSDTDWNVFNNKAPALGVDDNYVTDAEKIVIGNTSGTNTGDNAVNTLYSGLISSQWATNGSNISYSSGNVGIGTTTPASRLHIGVAPTASANYGTLSIGSGAFDGATSGHFVGSASGTSIGVNEVSGYAGNLMNLQIAGTSQLLVSQNSVALPASSNLKVNTINSTGTGYSLLLNSQSPSTANTFSVTLGSGTHSETSGTNGSLKIIPTYNQVASTAANTDLLINRTETSVGSGAQYLIDAQVGGVSRFSVNNLGQATVTRLTNSGNFYSTVGSGFTFITNGGANWTAGAASVGMSLGGLVENRRTGSQQTSVAITPIYNQTGSTASNTDLLINRTETLVGSGAQLLIDAQVGGVSKFKVDNLGYITSTGITTTAATVTIPMNTVSIGTTLQSTANIDAGGLTIQDLYAAAGTNSGSFITLKPGYTRTNISGTQAVVSITPTYNQATGTAANTDLLINRTETAVGSGVQRLIDAQVGGVTKFSVSNTGAGTLESLTVANLVYASNFLSRSSSVSMGIGGSRTYSTAKVGIYALAYNTGATNTSWTNTTGQSAGIAILPVYNQETGDAANTDLLINRTETAVGSGTQLLIDAQVGGVSKFSVSNTGVIQQAGCTTAGTISVDVSGNIICTPSSERFKNTVNDLDNSLSNIMALRPVSYNFNSDMNMGDRTYFGFISEEVAGVTSEFATHDKDGNPYGLDTNAILAGTVKAIQEMNLNLEDVNGLQGEVNGESFFSRLLSKLTTWLADATNGIAKIFTNEIETKSLCVSNDTGEKTCITKTQLDALLLNATIGAEPEPAPAPSPLPGEDEGEVVPPPVDPAPVDPAPVDPAPVDPAPTEPAPEPEQTPEAPAPDPTPEPAP